MTSLAVEAINVSRVYGSGHTAVFALREVDLSVTTGRWIGLKGRSGSGKTTLLNCIGGLDRPTSGEVRCFGKNVAEMNDRQLTAWRRDQIGIVFQAFALMPTLSAYENVELPARLANKMNSKIRRDRARECLSMVGLDKWMDHRPSEMSGGQQQRVAIARALVNYPRLLLADEPTGELDTTTAKQMLGLLRELCEKEKMTIVMSSHDPLALEHTDAVVELLDGHAVNTGMSNVGDLELTR
jgi:ABC-type lipoprotein export system ATPase subunit